MLSPTYYDIRTSHELRSESDGVRGGSESIGGRSGLKWHCRSRDSAPSPSPPATLSNA